MMLMDVCRSNNRSALQELFEGPSRESRGASSGTPAVRVRAGSGRAAPSRALWPQLALQGRFGRRFDKDPRFFRSPFDFCGRKCSNLDSVDFFYENLQSCSTSVPARDYAVETAPSKP